MKRTITWNMGKERGSLLRTLLTFGYMHRFPGNRPFHDFFHNMLFSETPRGKDSFSIMRHELKYFIDAGLEQFRVALKKEKAPRGEFVDVTGILDMSFLDTLRGETVVEYPTFYVWLKDEPQPSEILSLEEKRVLIRPLKRSHEEVDHEKEQDEKRLKMDNEENKADDIEEGELEEESKVDELEELDEESKVDELEEEEESKIDELNGLEEESNDVKEKEDTSE